MPELPQERTRRDREDHRHGDDPALACCTKQFAAADTTVSDSDAQSGSGRRTIPVGSTSMLSQCSTAMPAGTPTTIAAITSTM